MSYQLIQAKETSPLAEVPVDFFSEASLLRSRHGHTAMMISGDLVIPAHAKLELGGAELKFI